jgi:type III restriction enzyme
MDPNYQSVIGFFVQIIMKELRLVGCYDILFGKVKEFIAKYLFREQVSLHDDNVLRNLSEPDVTKTIIETFKREINSLTVQDVGDTDIKNYIKISNARPFVVTDSTYLIPKKCVFNKIVGDSGFELEFADFLERAGDVIGFAKNYQAIHFKIDYKNADGAIANYYPDFFVKTDSTTLYIVELKGQEDLDSIEKIIRLGQWCGDVNSRQKKITYKMLYVKQEEWNKYRPTNFKQLADTFS